MEGTVHFFDDKKGYGFITPDKAADDVFVHFTAIKERELRRLMVGQRVTFQVMEGHRGFQAINVRLIGENPLESDNDC
ncbi:MULTISPECIES: cold-shock protein [unclassified Ligilactobacillus]|uniref:cold-shock protein n=1 Tax=unclassified Ligilactobacillus TaxID=2767920 RepID=UPI003851AD67